MHFVRSHLVLLLLCCIQLQYSDSGNTSINTIDLFDYLIELSDALPEPECCSSIQQSSRSTRGLHRICMLPVAAQHLTAENAFSIATPKHFLLAQPSID